MNVLVTFNELSEVPLARDKREAVARVNQLVDSLAAIRRSSSRRLRPVLRCPRAFDELEIAPEYRVAHWRVDADRDRRLLFAQWAAATPALLPVEEGGPSDPFRTEATLSDSSAATPRSAIGLHAAWAQDGIAVSLASSAAWASPEVLVDIHTIEDDGIAETRELVRHVSEPAHVATHTGYLTELEGAPAGPAELWARRADLYPTLEFCPQVERQLLRFDAGSQHFQQILGRLRELERAFATWGRTPLNPQFVPSKCTPETPQTLREEAASHTASRQDGSSMLFSWHVRFTPAQGRIFFEGDPAIGRGVVGYIGLKKGGLLT